MTHLDSGGAARMVDVGEKPVSRRTATAECILRLRPETLAAVRGGALEKGDALQVARIAGIMAAKHTPDLIPLCHPLPLEKVDVDFEFAEAEIRVTAVARVTARTGVEMEALTAAAVAALTLVDMVKAVEPGAEIAMLRLVQKSGGKSGLWRRRP